MKKLLIFIFLFIVTMLLTGCDYFKNPRELKKSEIKEYFEDFNEEFSLNLPSDFETIFSYKESAIDSYEYLMVVKVLDEYKIKYNIQCECTEHKKFDIIEHFKLANDDHKELLELEKTLSDDYDWYAYEKRGDIRTYNLFVIRDNVTNYLYVYYICTQYTDCF